MKCLRCNGEMEHLGHESLQLGQYGFFTGHLSNLFSGALEVASPAASWSFIARTHPACPSG